MLAAAPLTYSAMESPGKLFIHHSANGATTAKDTAATIRFADTSQIGREERAADFVWEVINGKPCQDVSEPFTDDVIIHYRLPVLKAPACGPWST